MADLDMINKDITELSSHLIKERRVIVFDIAERVREMLGMINQQTS
jgi:hypothetical protein